MFAIQIGEDAILILQVTEGGAGLRGWCAWRRVRVEQNVGITVDGRNQSCRKRNHNIL